MLYLVQFPITVSLIVLLISNLQSDSAKTVTARVLNDKRLSVISNHLSDRLVLFDLIDIFDDINDKFHMFSKVIVDIVDEIAPIKNFVKKRFSCPLDG